MAGAVAPATGDRRAVPARRANQGDPRTRGTADGAASPAVAVPSRRGRSRGLAATASGYSTRIVAFVISSFSFVRPLSEPALSSAFRVSVPFTVSPNTVCLPSR